ncbi:unnamed protein product [Ixodes pacificus]
MAVPTFRAPDELLRDLHLDFNELQDLPQELSSMRHLRSLSVSGNRFTRLPDVLSRLAGLESLRLAGNAITETPQLALPNLRRLDLRGNHIRGLADFSRLQVHARNLHSLDVSWNQIESLVLPTTDRLRQLDCSRNQLQDLCLPGSRLHTLCSSHNRLRSIENVASASTLKYIDLSNNWLAQVPEWILQASSTHHLDLGHNQLTSLPAGYDRASYSAHCAGLGTEVQRNWRCMDARRSA